MEKQKAKYTYGILEKQFRNIYDKLIEEKVLQVSCFYSYVNLDLIMLYTEWVYQKQEMVLDS